MPFTRCLLPTPRVLLVALLAACGGGVPERDPTVTALQVELLQRGARDQAIRDSIFSPSGDDGMQFRMSDVDRENADWLEQQVRANGWPTRAKVGEGASRAAFLILQHATHNPTFQQRMLDTLARLQATGEVDGEEFALLYDRVQSQAGRKQRYGTQARFAKGAIVFDPIEDPARVDSLRRSVGLGSLAEYRRVLDSVYRRPAVPDSTSR